MKKRSLPSLMFVIFTSLFVFAACDRALSFRPAASADDIVLHVGDQTAVRSQISAELEPGQEREIQETEKSRKAAASELQKRSALYREVYTGISCTSNNPAVAEIQNDHVVATGIGETDLIITYYRIADTQKKEIESAPLQVSTTVHVTVHAVFPAEITVAEDTFPSVLQANEYLQLYPVVLPENTTDKGVSYVSSDESIAVVDESGVVTTLSPGTVEITIISDADENIRMALLLTVQ